MHRDSRLPNNRLRYTPYCTQANVVRVARASLQHRVSFYVSVSQDEQEFRHPTTLREVLLAFEMTWTPIAGKLYLGLDEWRLRLRRPTRADQVQIQILSTSAASIMLAPDSSSYRGKFGELLDNK